MFRVATRTSQPLRIALLGPAGSGKSFSALRIATGLLDPGQRLAVIDSEHGSASLYAGEPNPDGGVFAFDVVDLDKMTGKFSAENYVKSIRAARSGGYAALIIDSLSHAWAGPGGVLEYVENVGRTQKSGNKYAAWGEGTRVHNELVDEILSFPGHIIATLRTKVGYEQVGKEVRKVGLQPIQRDGVEYEFTVVCDIEQDSHRAIVSKSRCSALADRQFVKPGADIALVLRDWLAGGAPEGEGAAPPAEPAPRATADELGPFYASLHDLGIDHESLALFTEAKGMGHPDALPAPKRAALLARLVTDDGRAAYNAWRVEAGAR